jgi:GNAT superfamily N-acetyltransferase
MGSWPLTGQATHGADPIMTMLAPSPLLDQGASPAPSLALRPWYMTLADHDLLRQQITSGELRVHIRLADRDDLDTILKLIEEAKQWLPTIGTSQWSTDWKNGEGLSRSERVERSLKEGSTWLAYVLFQEEDIPVATVTIGCHADSMVWSDLPAETSPCAYLGRLVTARDFAGLEIGTAVIDWACQYAATEFGSEYVRIDVWTDNFRLHDYYLARGFRSRGLCPHGRYPSRARFDRRTGLRTRRPAPVLVRD